MAAFSFSDTNQFLPLRLGPTARDTLREFIDIDVTAGDLVRILNANQAYRDFFFRFVAKKTARLEKEGSPETSPTHRLINLLGMLGSRNLILALRIHRLTTGTLPEDPGTLRPPDFLKMSLEAEELFTRNKLEYGETAYAGGVYFDLSIRVVGDEAAKKLTPYFKRTWQRALRTGMIAQQLAEKTGAVPPRSALAAGMLAHGGKIHLAACLSGYAEFEEELDKRDEVNGIARTLLEREQFGVTQEQVGAHTLRYFDVFRELLPAVGNFREPYNLKGADEVEHSLAVVLYLADAMARSWRIPKDEKDPIFESWAYAGGVKIRRADLIAVMQRVMAYK